MKKPSLEEIEHYCRVRNSPINPEQFFDYQESTGWVVGKSRKPMKDWQAAIRTWERNRKPENRPSILDKLTDRSWA